MKSLDLLVNKNLVFLKDHLSVSFLNHISHSLIPGFDLSSAYLNNEEMLLDVKTLCQNGANYSFESTFFFIISSPINDYKIETNQWSTVTQ